MSSLLNVEYIKWCNGACVACSAERDLFSVSLPQTGPRPKPARDPPTRPLDSFTHLGH